MKCVLLLQKEKEHKIGRKNTKKKTVKMVSIQPNVSVKVLNTPAKSQKGK